MIYFLNQFICLLFLTAWEGQLFLVDGDRRTDKERGNMRGQSIVEAALFQQGLLHLGTDLAEVAIVMEVLNVLMIRNIAANRRISRLADVVF